MAPHSETFIEGGIRYYVARSNEIAWCVTNRSSALRFADRMGRSGERLNSEIDWIDE